MAREDQCPLAGKDHPHEAGGEPVRIPRQRGSVDFPAKLDTRINVFSFMQSALGLRHPWG